MEFGVFIPIANVGWIMSATSPKYAPTFAHPDRLPHNRKHANYSATVTRP